MPATCLEHSVHEAAAAFVRQIGSLSHEPEVRDILLKTAVHEVPAAARRFGDHYRLAEQLEIMSRLAGLGPEAFHAAGLADRRCFGSIGTSHPRAAPGQRPNPAGAAGSPARSLKSRQLDNAALAELDR